MLGSGRMWVAPAALEDPRAVKISMQGQGLPTEALLKSYLPPVSMDCSSVEAVLVYCCCTSSEHRIQAEVHMAFQVVSCDIMSSHVMKRNVMCYNERQPWYNDAAGRQNKKPLQVSHSSTSFINLVRTHSMLQPTKGKTAQRQSRRSTQCSMASCL